MTDPTAIPSFGGPADATPPATKDDLLERVQPILAQFGTNPEVDPDGDLMFTADDTRLFLRTFPGELQAMQISGHWTIDEKIKDDQAKLYEVCNNVNMGMHVAKVGIVNGSLVCAAELVADSDETLPGMIHLSISTILTAVRVWHEQALGLEPGSLFPQPEDEGNPTTEV